VKAGALLVLDGEDGLLAVATNGLTRELPIALVGKDGRTRKPRSTSKEATSARTRPL
jgi:hypothetical protein